RMCPNVSQSISFRSRGARASHTQWLAVRQAHPPSKAAMPFLRHPRTLSFYNSVHYVNSVKNAFPPRFHVVFVVCPSEEQETLNLKPETPFQADAGAIGRITAHVLSALRISSSLL